MARKHLIRTNSHPYHVTCRANNRDEFWCDQSLAWHLFSNKLKEIIKRHEVKIHAFVMMPNHFHLVITVPKDDLGIVMQRFMAEITKVLNFVSKRTGRVFGGRYHWSVIYSEDHYDRAVKYVYRNPVKAGMVDRAEDYRFSSLPAVVQMREFDFPVTPSFEHTVLIPNNNKDEYLAWVNEPFLKEQEQELYESLKRRQWGGGV